MKNKNPISNGRDYTGEITIMIGGAEVKRVIRERCEMSVSPYNNRFYLKKVFRSKFRHEVEISVCQSEECDLVVRETEEGTIRAVYYSKENMERLKQLTECRESMRFVFFETEEIGVWQGILLPELKQSKEEEIYECSRIGEWIACHTYTERGRGAMSTSFCVSGL